MTTQTTPHIRLFTVDEYYRLAEVGILSPDDSVELIEGEIYHMLSLSPRHASCDLVIQSLFAGTLDQEQTNISIRSPLRLDQYSELEPDIMLLKYKKNNYADAHPGSQDVLLLIEVADESLLYDRELKFPLYARHGIQEAWLVDLVSEAIEVHRSPSEGGYLDVRVLRGEDALAPLAFPDCTLTVNAILGKE
jgi:MEMO1 family protein